MYQAGEGVALVDSIRPTSTSYGEVLGDPVQY